MTHAGVGWLVAILVIAAPLAGATRVGAESVDCSDPQVRQAIQTAQASLSQALAAYNASPPDVRQAMDQSARQSTGYSFTQLIQFIAVCGRDRPPTLPTVILPDPAAHEPALPLPAPVAPVPRVFRPDQYQFPGPAVSPRTITDPALFIAGSAARVGPLAAVVPSDGAVLIGSGELKLGWQLYGRTDLSEHDAAVLYEQRAQAEIADLERQKAAADATADGYARQHKLFDAATKSQNIEGVVNALRQDDVYFSEQRKTLIEDATQEAGWAVLEAIVPGAAAVNIGLQAADVYLQLKEKAGSGERLDAGNRAALADFVGNTQKFIRDESVKHSPIPDPPIAEVIDRGATIANVGVKLVLAGYADYALKQVDLEIQRPLDTLAAHAALLASREAAARQASSELAARLARQQHELTAILGTIR